VTLKIISHHAVRYLERQFICILQNEINGVLLS